MPNNRHDDFSSSPIFTGHSKVVVLSQTMKVDGAPVKLDWGRDDKGHSYAKTTPRVLDLEDAAIAALDASITASVGDVEFELSIIKRGSP